MPAEILTFCETVVFVFSNYPHLSFIYGKFGVS